MKIIINEETDAQKIIRIPTGLLTNRLSAFIAAHTVAKESGLTASQMMKVIGALKEYRKDHPEWAVVEVDDKDGKRVFQLIL